jgi:hypothetical protein
VDADIVSKSGRRKRDYRRCSKQVLSHLFLSSRSIAREECLTTIIVPA